MSTSLSNKQNVLIRVLDYWTLYPGFLDKALDNELDYNLPCNWIDHFYVIFVIILAIIYGISILSGGENNKKYLYAIYSMFSVLGVVTIYRAYRVGASNSLKQLGSSIITPFAIIGYILTFSDWR